MTFTSTEHKNARGHADGCHLDKTPSAEAAAKLLGVTFEDLASALTTRAIRAGNDVIHTSMDIIQSKKACEALMKATYGAAFDFIVAKVNANISSNQPQDNCACASIGVLDIFGFETFESNNFEQICINYTNEVSVMHLFLLLISKVKYFKSSYKNCAHNQHIGTPTTIQQIRLQTRTGGV